MEPHATTAAVIGWHGDRVDLLAGKCSSCVRRWRAVGLPESKMRIICTKVGGGFGGKMRLKPVAIALATKATGR